MHAPAFFPRLMLNEVESANVLSGYREAAHVVIGNYFRQHSRILDVLNEIANVIFSEATPFLQTDRLFHCHKMPFDHAKSRVFFALLDEHWPETNDGVCGLVAKATDDVVKYFPGTHELRACK